MISKNYQSKLRQSFLTALVFSLLLAAVASVYPQKFVPNIFKAKDSDFQKATQRIFRSGANATHIALPVIESTK
ncbi:MAG TPA: hypothetical protein VK892_15680 [Pyrinomonadaceae bacterium]|nr:hypothetical protein [Pyrinomonadaceae bacterium]